MITIIRLLSTIALIFLISINTFSQDIKAEEKKVLVIINGKQRLWNQGEVATSIDYPKIKSINYLTDSLARIKKYGEKAKYGVIIITYKNSPKKTISKTPFQKSSSDLTKIKFDRLNYSFNKINVNDTAAFIFRFMNIGNTTLTINKLKSSCGCTTTKCPEKNINPGQAGTITVSYCSSTSKEFSENVTVYYNGTDSPIKITISGVVSDANK